MSKKNDLIIACVGDKSYHKHWLKGAKRSFDIVLIYFGKINGKFREDADYYFHIQDTFKLETIYAITHRIEAIVKKYDSIGLPDDDCFIDCRSINKLFGFFHKYDLDLAQPAVSTGKISHPITKQNRGYILRYTNFIEAQFPIFKNKVFFDLLNTFTLNRSGWGIDYVWSKMLEKKNIAIIDAVGICHGWGEPSAFYKRLKTAGIDPEEEMASLISKYNINLTQKVNKKINNSIVGRILLKVKTLRNKSFFEKHICNFHQQQNGE